MVGCHILAIILLCKNIVKNGYRQANNNIHAKIMSSCNFNNNKKNAATKTILLY